jgi:integrase
MAKRSSLEPRFLKSRDSWVLNVPAELADTGKRRQLFYATKKAASAEAEKLRARADNFGISLTALTPVRIAQAAEAFKISDSLGVDLLDAVRGYAEFHKARTASKPWGEVFDEYLAMPKKRSTKYSRELAQARRAMERFDRAPIVDVSAQDVEKALSAFAPSTRNAKMRVLRAIFNLGIKRGYLQQNPIARLDFSELDSSEVEVFTPGQVEAMLSFAREHDLALLPFLTLGCFCGIRPDGELQKLQWSSVHLTGKAEVEIPANVSKTKRRRFVDLSENALAWLEAYRQRGGIMEGAVTPYRTQNLRNHRRAAQKAAGIEHWIQQGMRHSYCSAWLAKHHDVNRLVLQSGHTDPDTMWTHYHRGMSHAEAEKFWSIVPPEGDVKIIAFASA